MQIKTKINKWDLIKHKSSAQQRKPLKKKMKRQPTEWENIFGNKAADKGLISQNIHNSPAAEHQHKQTNNQSKNGQRI